MIEMGKGSKVIRFKIESKVNGNAEQLYLDLLTMGSVNYELMPVVKMTVPSKWASTHLKLWPIGTELFSSVILLFGIIPVDLHKFKLSKVNESGFKECSSTLTNKEWNHSRTIKKLGSTCLVTDELEIFPRFRFLGGVMAPIYKTIFKHRHKRLYAKYGAIS